MLLSKTIFSGMCMGIIHVLAGVDHLSALATLAVGSSWKAFTIGIRWGLGHSTGLISMTAVFLFLKEELDLQATIQFCNIVVGIMMIILGLHGAYTAYSVHLQKNNKKSNDDIEAGGDSHTNEANILCQCGKSLASYKVDFKDARTGRIVAYFIGVLHGIAGPGTILGVIPAVEMHSWHATALYLVSFIAASTCCMGFFASIFGEVTRRAGAASEQIEFILNASSAVISLIVGVMWLVFGMLGRLDDFFE